MLLGRLGAKWTMAQKIIEHFPAHDVYIELFFGSGAIFFTKPRVQYNILNDIDKEVANVFRIVKEQPQQLIEALEMTPYCQGTLEIFKEGKFTESDPIWRAVSFLFRSNFTLMGKGGTIVPKINNYKQILLERILETWKYIAQNGNVWLNASYEKVFDMASIQNYVDGDRVFCYADPPYVGTTNAYGSGMRRTVWTIEDFKTLIAHLMERRISFAVSEYANEEVIAHANDLGFALLSG